MKDRCDWGLLNPLMLEYHDKEWGVPVFDDQKLYEHILLDTFQAGLSWAIILNKRENFRKAFNKFNPNKISIYDDNRIDSLMIDKGIIRNRQKIKAAINNARVFLNIQEKYGSFAKFFWGFSDGETIINHYKSWRDIPPKTELSDRMSKEFKSYGFLFTGSTVCYAIMQASGMVNDHVVTCFRHKELAELSKKLIYPV